MNDMTEHQAYENDHLLTDEEIERHRAASDRAQRALNTCRIFKAVEFCHVRISGDDLLTQWAFVKSVDVSSARVVLADSATYRRGGACTTVVEGIDAILKYLAGRDVAVVESETGLR